MKKRSHNLSRECIILANAVSNPCYVLYNFFYSCIYYRSADGTRQQDITGDTSDLDMQALSLSLSLSLSFFLSIFDQGVVCERYKILFQTFREILCYKKETNWSVTCSHCKWTPVDKYNQSGFYTHSLWCKSISLLISEFHLFQLTTST